MKEGKSPLPENTNAECLATSAAGVDGGPRLPQSLPTLVLTFAASGPQGRSAAGSPAHRAPSATRVQIGTAPRSHPWRFLQGKQTRGSHLYRAEARVGGQLLPFSSWALSKPALPCSEVSVELKELKGPQEMCEVSTEPECLLHKSLMRSPTCVLSKGLSFSRKLCMNNRKHFRASLWLEA
jgi:hypothetical protein